MSIDKVAKTQSAANAFCVEGGATLASIHSAADHTAVMSMFFRNSISIFKHLISAAYINTNFDSTYFLGDANKNAWIGFSDSATQNTWLWSDSSDNAFTAWLGG
jgi:hypothetical protein